MLIVGEQASSILRNHISVPAILSIQREMIGISILGTSHLGHPSSPDSLIALIALIALTALSTVSSLVNVCMRPNNGKNGCDPLEVEVAYLLV